MPVYKNLNLYMVDDPIVWWILAHDFNECIKLLLAYEDDSGSCPEDNWPDGLPEPILIKPKDYNKYWFFDDNTETTYSMDIWIKWHYYPHVIACSEY